MKKINRLSLLLLTSIVMAGILMSCGDGGDSTQFLDSPPPATRDFDTRRYMLFAHGMGDNPGSWDNFAAAAGKRGFTVLRTQVPRCGSIEDRATDLADYINDNIPAGAKAKAVGHSMGGLDLRKIVGAGYDEESPYYQAARKLSKVYTMATPHGGQFFADRIPITAGCEIEDPARQDLSDDSMAVFNENYPYANFSVDGITMPFLSFHFQCWSCGGINDCVVGTGNQSWEGAPQYYTTLSGKHSNDLVDGWGGAGCTAEQDNIEEVLYPIINDAIHGYVAPAAGREVRLVSMRSGRCADVAGHSRDNHANVQQWDCGNHLPNQVFRLEESSSPDYYFLKSIHSGKCLDVEGGTGATENGANIQQYDCADVANQKFTFEPAGVGEGAGYFEPPGDGGGMYYIKAMHSDKCLDVAGATTENGANIQQYSCTDVPQQKWRLAEATDKSVKIVSKKSGKVLDVAGNSASNGANIQQWEYEGVVNQWFVMVRMKEEGTQDEYYKIIAQNSGKCLDIAGAGMDDTANLQLYDCEYVDNQKFTLESAGDGYYWIKIQHSGKCLDLAGGDTADGANIQQYHCVDNQYRDNQLWKIEKNLWE